MLLTVIYPLSESAKCQKCFREVTEKTLVESNNLKIVSWKNGVFVLIILTRYDRQTHVLGGQHLPHSTYVDSHNALGSNHRTIATALWSTYR